MCIAVLVTLVSIAGLHGMISFKTSHYYASTCYYHVPFDVSKSILLTGSSSCRDAVAGQTLPFSAEVSFQDKLPVDWDIARAHVAPSTMSPAPMQC